MLLLLLLLLLLNSTHFFYLLHLVKVHMDRIAEFIKNIPTEFIKF